MVRRSNPTYVTGKRPHLKIQPTIVHPPYCACALCADLPADERGRAHQLRNIKRASIHPDDYVKSAVYALQVKAEEEAKLSAGGDGWMTVSAELMTVAQAARAYVDAHPRNRREEAILRLHVIPLLGTLVVAQFKAADWRHYQRKRQEDGASPDTINREWNALNSALNFAEREERIERNPIRRGAIRPLESRGGRKEFFEPEEWRAFIDAFGDFAAFKRHVARQREAGPVRIVDGVNFGSGKRHPESDATRQWYENFAELQPFMRGLLFTCARQGELVALRWRDVDLRRGLITLYQDKTQKEKTLPIAAPLREELHSRRRGLPDAFVYTRSSGQPFDKETVRRGFHLALAIADVRKRLVPHSIRHTVLSWLAIAGVSEVHRKEIAGHSRTTVTDGYSHLTKGSLVPVMATLARIEADGFREEESVGAAAKVAGASSEHG